MIDQQQDFEERARIGFDESMILTCTLKRVAGELGMPSERFWAIRKEVEIDFNQWRLEDREKRGEL